MRARPDDRDHQGRKDGLQVESIVKAELELREIPGKVPCAAPSADAKDVALQIGDHRVHGLERLHLGTPPAALALDRLMGCARVGDATKGGKAIGNDMGFRSEGLFCPGNDSLALEIRQNFEDGVDDLPVVLHRRLDCHKEWLLARCTTPPFAVVSGTPGIGIVDLDPVLECSASFRRVRGAEDLLLQIVGGGVADAQAALEFQGRDGVLALGEPKHGLEPGPKGEVTGLTHRSHHDGGLVTTCLALEKPALGHKVGFAAATLGTVEPNRPFRLHHGLQALLFGAVSGLKIAEGQTLLELYVIDGHGTPLERDDRSPVWTMVVAGPHQNWFSEACG